MLCLVLRMFLRARARISCKMKRRGDFPQFFRINFLLAPF